MASIDLSSPAPTASTRRTRSTHPFALMVMIVLGTAVISYALWSQYFRVPTDDTAKTDLAVTGFRPPVVNKLDPAFTDADGDLVADPPTDPSKLIDPPTLEFCFIAKEEPEKSAATWKPFMDYLSKSTGKPVEYVLLTTRDEELKALRDGKLHVAAFNTGNVPVAVNLCGFVPVCGIPTADGTALTHTEIIVSPDSSLQKPVDLKGHELTLTEPGSNSGYKAPLVLLRSQFGLQPMSDVHPRYSGSHEASIAGIASKQYEAAAVASDMLARAVAAGVIKTDQYRTIYTSESFPTAGLGYVYNLKPDLAAKVKDALLSYDWKGTPIEEVFTGVKTTKFVPVNYKDDWSLIRRIDDEMGVVQKID